MGKKSFGSLENFKNFVKEQTGDEYTVTGNYVNDSTKIDIRHNKCKDGGIHPYSVTPSHFKSGKRCPKGAGNIPYTLETFKDAVYLKYGNEYSVLSTEYNKDLIEMKHNTCGHTWNVVPKVFIKTQGTRCPKCFPQKVRKENDEFLKQVYEQVKDEYTFLEEYQTNDTKIYVRHNSELCDFHEYKVTPDGFLNSHNRCPRCNEIIKESKGIRKISEYLDQLEIKYKKEHPITEDEVENKRSRLRFDFYLTEYNIAIEYDGSQHYNRKFNMSEEEFLNTQERDKRKNKFCLENNIPLLRIPYFKESNIDDILQKFLLKNDVIEIIET